MNINLSKELEQLLLGKCHVSRCEDKLSVVLAGAGYGEEEAQTGYLQLPGHLPQEVPE